MSETINKWNN